MSIGRYCAFFLNLAKGLLLLVAVAAALPAFASQDKNPPAMPFFTYSPQSVDVTNGPATFNVTINVTDDLSGVNYVQPVWFSPDGKYDVGGATGLSSGTNL